MRTVLVLGATGMLGHLIARVLSTVPSLRVVGTSRNGIAGTIPFAVGGTGALAGLVKQTGAADYIINAIAVLRPDISEGDPQSMRQALAVNADFPRHVADCAAVTGARVLHISTDAVFPTSAGTCFEDTPPAPEEPYGRTKHLGEISAPRVLNLRCSIIGPSPFSKRGVLEWLRHQPANTSVVASRSSVWRGVTTLQLAEACRDLIDPACFDAARSEGSVQHFCPNPAVSKHELFQILTSEFRSDIRVIDADEDRPTTRVLETQYSVLPSAFRGIRELNPAIWALKSLEEKTASQ